MKISEKEISLIKILRENSREKILPLSKRLGIPKSTLFDALKRLQKEKIISPKTLVNFEKIGFPIKILLAIKTEYSKRDILSNELKNHKNVNSVHIINNGFDFLAECIFQNQKEEQDFLDELESKHTILEKNIYNIISDLKKEEFSEIYSKIDKRYKEDSKE